MNSKQIEDIAIMAVKSAIMHLDSRLSPYISDNDKEPSWDGFIYLYNSADHIKKNFEGRVAVQVKGKLMTNKTSKSNTYPIDIVDLESYSRDNGVVFFVVYINKDTLERIIYYCLLTPVKLANILKNNSNKKTKSIEFKEFPRDSISQYLIFKNFYTDSRKQISFDTKNIISLDDLCGKTIKGYTYLAKDDILTNSMQQLSKAFNKNEIYFYVSENGNQIPTNLYTSENFEIGLSEVVPQSISINNIIYYDNFRRTFYDESLVIEIGESLTITITEDKQINFNFSASSFAKKCIKDLDFFLKLVENGYSLSIGGNDFCFSNIKEDKPKHLEYRLLYASQIVELLDILHIEEDINIDTLSTKDMFFINTLLKAILSKEDVDINLENDKHTLVEINVANITIRLAAIKQQDSRYTLYDFFSPNIGAKAEQRNQYGDVRILSVFSTLEITDYVKLANIDCRVVLNSYKDLEDYDYIFDLAVNDMLRILSAYDITSKKKLLQLAFNLSDWILEKSEDNVPYEIKMLNHLQIIKRKREYNQKEINQLIELSENPDTQIKIGANILLDDVTKAKVYLSRLSEEEQESIKAFPIYNFIKNNPKQV